MTTTHTQEVECVVGEALTCDVLRQLFHHRWVLLRERKREMFYFAFSAQI